MEALIWCAIFILWKKSKQDSNLRLVLSSTAALYILVFNPLWVPFLMERITYLIIRFSAAVPTMLVVACLIKALWNKIIKRKNGLSIFRTVFGCAVIFVLLTPPFISNFTRFSYIGDRRESNERKSALQLTDLYSKIDEYITPGNVIASDPVTSYCIPAFCDQFVVCTFDQHSTPNDSTALDRIMACRDIYLPTVSCEEVIRTLEKYGAGYVVVNGRIPKSVMGDYWRPDRNITRDAFMKLKSCENHFKLLYSRNHISLFKYMKSTGGVPEISSASKKPLNENYRGEFQGDYKLLTPSEVDGIYLKTWGKDSDRVEKGDTLKLFVDWVAEREIQPGSYIIYVRFDTDFEKGPLYHESYGKVYRKTVEKIRGKRFRFLEAKLPFKGIYPPDKWIPGQIIRENINVPIPEDIVEGTYTISVKMNYESHKPNYRIQDFLSDDDMYDGPDIMTVHIR